MASEINGYLDPRKDFFFNELYNNRILNVNQHVAVLSLSGPSFPQQVRRIPDTNIHYDTI